jgi:hypothetical protein
MGLSCDQPASKAGSSSHTNSMAGFLREEGEETKKQMKASEAGITKPILNIRSPRKSRRALALLFISIQEFGFKVRRLPRRRGVRIEGCDGRLRPTATQKLGMTAGLSSSVTSDRRRR